MRVIRLWRSTLRRRPGSRKNDDLRVVGHAHAEPPLDQRRQYAPTRQIAHIALELRPLRLQLHPPLLEHADVARPRYARRPPPDDARGDENETEERQRHPRAPARGYAALRHARRCALRARELTATSAGLAVAALRVSVVPSARPPHVHTGCLGGHVHAVLHARNVCLTIRS